MAEYPPFAWPDTQEEAESLGWVKRRYQTRRTYVAPNRTQLYRDMAERLLRMKGAWPSTLPFAVPDFDLRCRVSGPVQSSGDLSDLVAELFALRDVAKGLTVSENTFRALSSARRWGGTSVYMSGKCRTVSHDVAQAVQDLGRVAKALA